MTIQKISISAYNELPYLRNSDLKHFMISPAHYFHHVQSQSKTSAPLRLGSAVHCLILEPENFEKEIAVFHGGQSTTVKAWHPFYAAIQKEGKSPLLEKEFEHAKTMANRVRQTNPAVMGLIERSKVELTGTAKIQDVWCKARYDGWCEEEKILWDLKTTGSLAREFKSSIYMFNYHIQAAFYTMVMEANDTEVNGFRFVVVESSPPYESLIVELSPEFIKLGREIIDSILPRFAECLKNSYWPGYDNSMIEVIEP